MNNQRFKPSQRKPYNNTQQGAPRAERGSGPSSDANRTNSNYYRSHPRDNSRDRKFRGSDIPLMQNTLKGAPHRRHSNDHRQSQRRPGDNIASWHIEKVFRRYLYLQELHQMARHKFFENQFKTDEKLKHKLENNFLQTSRDIRHFLESLSLKQRELFNQTYDNLPLDTTYSENHKEDSKTESPLQNYQIKDPHILSSQSTRDDYSRDKEETSGSFEDYKLIKNIQ